MGGSGYHWRIIGSLAVAGLMIGGAYWLAQDANRPSRAEASTQSALLKAITSRDTDGDGLPDWQESLYGTDPHQVDTRGLGMTDAEAVTKGLVVPVAAADIPVAAPSDTNIVVDGVKAPAEGTLTAAFAQSFFTLYLQAKESAGGVDLSQEQMQAVADQALSSLIATTQLAPDYKKESEILVGESGTDALKTYAATVEGIFLSNTAKVKKGELAYLADALERNDDTALSAIAEISKTYRSGALGLAQVRVPPELVESHLLLVNAAMRLSQIQADFARYREDPLVAIFALQQYPYAGQAFARAFAGIGSVYRAKGVSLSAGEQGAQFLSVALTTTVPEPQGKTP